MCSCPDGICSLLRFDGAMYALPVPLGLLTATVLTRTLFTDSDKELLSE
jgi:hypothetical protein